jgi:hypothetical protein
MAATGSDQGSERHVRIVITQHMRGMAAAALLQISSHASRVLVSALVSAHTWSSAWQQTASCLQNVKERLIVAGHC